MTEPTETMSFATRLWFAWVCFFRVLFDGEFAARAWEAREARALPPAPEPEPALPPKPKKKKVEPEKIQPPSTDAALQLLALLQREGRLVDFVEQDITSFPDAEVGAAARVVHEGCRKAIRAHLELAPVRDEEEDASVTLPEGYSPAEVKLSGNVQGSAPYKGVLRHRGWRAKEIRLPTPVQGHDPTIIAPAEVEL